MEKQCSRCGSDVWNLVLEDDYPERRQERDRTVKFVYECESCGAEGRLFEHNNGDGPDTYAGALR